MTGKNSFWMVVVMVVLVLVLGSSDVSAQFTGVLDITSQQIADLNTCVGRRAVQRVQLLISRWKVPCEQLWDNPVFTRRSREVNGRWESVLWNLVFRQNLTSQETPPVCIPVNDSTSSPLNTTVNGSSGVVDISSPLNVTSPRAMFVIGCMLRGAGFLNSTDGISEEQINTTLASFNVSANMLSILYQSKDNCLSYASTLQTSDLEFPLNVELGRQLAFFDCAIQSLLTGCKENAITEGLLNGILEGNNTDDIFQNILGK